MANVCPECGAAVDAGAKQCKYCGSAIPQTAAVQTQQQIPQNESFGDKWKRLGKVNIKNTSTTGKIMWVIGILITALAPLIYGFIQFNKDDEASQKEGKFLIWCGVFFIIVNIVVYYLGFFG